MKQERDRGCGCGSSLRLHREPCARAILLFFFICSLAGIFSEVLSPHHSWRSDRSRWNGRAVCTAYNSLPEQTQGDPWITAAGTRCRPGVVAANFLPFGTVVQLEGFGNRAFTVEDRMAKRFSDRIDIWFASYADTKEFGKRRLRYRLLPKKNVPQPLI